MRIREIEGNILMVILRNVRLSKRMAWRGLVFCSHNVGGFSENGNLIGK